MILINSYFDPTLESPQVAIWLWTLVGIGLGLAAIARRAAAPRAAGTALVISRLGTSSSCSRQKRRGCLAWSRPKTDRRDRTSGRTEPETPGGAEHSVPGREERRDRECDDRVRRDARKGGWTR